MPLTWRFSLNGIAASRSLFLTASTRSCPYLLHADEQRFNCAEVPGYFQDGQAAFVIWNVLGFGGKANPLVYARIASMAARAGQALLDVERARLQLYVDDPAVVVVGDEQVCRKELSFWLLLGLRLSWQKGFHVVTDDHYERHLAVEHTWITCSIVHAHALTYLTLEFVEGPRGLSQACSSTWHGSVAVAPSAAGTAFRIAYVIPTASAFAAAVWAALVGSSRAKDSSRPHDAVAPEAVDHVQAHREELHFHVGIANFQKADPQALGTERTHGRACQDRSEFALCPVHVLCRQRSALRRWHPELHSSEGQPHASLFVFPAEGGEKATKVGMATVEHFAVQSGYPRRLPEGHSALVTACALVEHKAPCLVGWTRGQFSHWIAGEVRQSWTASEERLWLNRHDGRRTCSRTKPR